MSRSQRIDVHSHAIPQELLEALERDSTRYEMRVDRAVVASSNEEYAAVLRADVEKWTKVVKSAGIKPE